MKTYSIFKNGIHMNTLSAKDLQSAIRLAGVFTDKGVYVEHKPLGSTKSQEGFCEVKHDDVYDIYEYKKDDRYRLLVTDVHGGSPIVIDFDSQEQADQALQNINQSPSNTAINLY